MDYIEIIKSIIFDIVEGITEWLPISSTGHMILLDEFLKLNMSKDFKEMFEVVIQLGAILAVVVLFWNNLFPFTFKKGFAVKKDIMSMWGKILIACVPVIIIGFPLDHVFSKLFHYDDPNNPTRAIIVSIALIVFGIIFIVIENKNKNSKPRINSISSINYRVALFIGVFQLIAAVFPGTSRSGATIIGALLIGVSRTVAAEFTFFLAVPVMFGASALKLVKFGFNFTPLELAVLFTGLVTAFIVSIIAIKFLMGYIKKHDFKVFGWYRIILGVIVITYFAIQSFRQ